jgi:hypothetical protein
LSPGELLELTRYVLYRTAWRHAPRMLRQIEQRAHALRNRRLDRRLLSVDVPEAGVLSAGWVGWDEAFFGYLRRRLNLCSEQAPARVIVHGALNALTTRPETCVDFDADLAFVEVPEWRAHEFASAGWLILPKRVAHLEDLKPNPAGEASYAESVRRAALRARLECEISIGERDLEEFYHALYLPMVQRRHAALARPTPLSLLRLFARRGCLVRVLQRGRWLSGALLAPHPLWSDAMSIVVVGVREGDYRAVPDAARAAPILFAREEAQRRGARVCDHLVTRAFISDGLFRRKRRWETRVHDVQERPDRLAFRVLRDGPLVQRWLQENPLIACGEAGLVGIAWGTESESAARALAIPGVAARYSGSSVADLCTLASSLRGMGMTSRCPV